MTPRERKDAPWLLFAFGIVLGFIIAMSFIWWFGHG